MALRSGTTACGAEFARRVPSSITRGATFAWSAPCSADGICGVGFGRDRFGLRVWFVLETRSEGGAGELRLSFGPILGVPLCGRAIFLQRDARNQHCAGRDPPAAQVRFSRGGIHVLAQANEGVPRNAQRVRDFLERKPILRIIQSFHTASSGVGATRARASLVSNQTRGTR